MLQITVGKVVAFATVAAYPLSKATDLAYSNSLFRVLPVSILVWAVVKCLLYPNFFSPLRHLPSVDADKWWSPQSLKIFRGNRGDCQAEWVDNIPHNGLIRYRTVTNQERILVASPEALGEVLVTKSYQFVKPEVVVTALKQTAGMGILLAEGDHHKAQRKSLMPAFTFRHIKDLYSTMWDMSAYAVDALMHDAASKKDLTIDITDWASSVTLGIICVAGLGSDMESVLSQDSSYTNLRKIYRSVFHQERADIIMFFLRVWVLPAWALPLIPLKRNRVLKRAGQSLRSECRKLIRQKKLELENGVTDETEKNILTVALSYGGFTDEELVDQLLTFLAAGHETTATALTWAIYILSTRPEIQTRLREEIRANLPAPSSSSSPNTQELAATIDSHMPYLSAVCREVLRFFSPVSMTFREAAVDTAIQGCKIPKGTQIVICPRATNRDETLWGEDAKTFNPERYLSQGKQEHSDPLDEDHHSRKSTTGHRSNYATLTFLHGPRSCIGQSFSKAELAILVSTLVGRFKFSLADESQADLKNIRLRRGGINRPVNGLNVKVKLVDGW